MTCGCKHKKGKKGKKRGSGRAHFLSGVTWHKGSGFRKKRKKTKRGGGTSFSGGGISFDGAGLRFVVNKKINGRRVI